MKVKSTRDIMADCWKLDVNLFLEPWTFWRKCASWNSMELHIDSKRNECTSTSITICEPVNLPVKESESKPSVMKILSTSTSPSEIYGQMNLPVEITTPSNLGPSTIYFIRNRENLFIIESGSQKTIQTLACMHGFNIKFYGLFIV